MTPSLSVLVGLPIFNEEQYLPATLNALEEILLSYPRLDLLLFDDGSSDSTPSIIQQTISRWPGRVQSRRHDSSLGYGQTVIDILRFGCVSKDSYDVVITFDADLQHDPATIPRIMAMMEDANHVDVVSTSRYLSAELVHQVDNVPYDRFLVNMVVTRLINTLFDFSLSDSFCGLKGYRVCRVERMFKLQDVGYSSPLEFWAKAAYHGLFIDEVATPLIYQDDRRGRGDWQARLHSYLDSLAQFAWTDDQRAYVEVCRPVLEDFVEARLVDASQQPMVRSPTTSYSSFWSRHEVPHLFPHFDRPEALTSRSGETNPLEG